MNLIHVLNCRSVEMNLKKVFFKQRATGWPDVLMGPVLNGLARPVNRPTDRAWACKQTRCPIGARPGGTPCQSGPCPYGPCLARARAGPCRAGPLLNFNGGWLSVYTSADPGSQYNKESARHQVTHSNSRIFIKQYKIFRSEENNTNL